MTLETKNMILYDPKEDTTGFWFNGVEIINIQEFATLFASPDGKNTMLWVENKKEGFEITFNPGDIFDLPQGFQFKEELFVEPSVSDVGYKVLRLVKTETFKERSTKLFPQPEPEESQDELWKEAQERVHEFIIKEHAAGRATGRISEFEYMKKYFTIQRKKQ